ncbi:MAG TPA: hypothetical protein VNC16_04180 [Solirubrobacterales bacterium]|nr:hypothetical protein [Solirubrobacterales bacterium]
MNRVAGGNAGTGQTLGNREADEEQNEESAEEDQREALPPGGVAALRRFSASARSTPLARFRSHRAGSIVKTVRLSRL